MPRSRKTFPRRLAPGAILAVVLVAGCGVEEILLEPFRGETPHERYVEQLERAGLTDAALTRDWIRASREAVERPMVATPPMIEEGWFPREDPVALGFEIEMLRGQRLRLELDLEDEADAVVFMEVFRVRGSLDDEDPGLLTVAWTDSVSRELTYDARATATFLVRVQPELLRGGAYSLSLQVSSSLAFPVDGGGVQNIRSYFGAPRDGGAREHHGVDIFAPRGTPVLAASAGRVRRVQTTPIGGEVVWVRNDERGHSEYYAHLDLQLVEPGDEVLPGDTLGLVGNSGNAITTPPHLHFGIYARGAVDPFPYLNDPGGRAVPTSIARDWFHAPVRVSTGGAIVRSGPSGGTEVLVEVGANVPVRVMAGNGEWARVRLPDRREGYVPASRLEEAADPVVVELAAEGRVVHRDPHPDAPGVRFVPAGAEVAVLGQYGEWRLVRLEESAIPGWIRAPELPGERTE